MCINSFSCPTDKFGTNKFSLFSVHMVNLPPTPIFLSFYLIFSTPTALSNLYSNVIQQIFKIYRFPLSMLRIFSKNLFNSKLLLNLLHLNFPNFLAILLSSLFHSFLYRLYIFNHKLFKQNPQNLISITISHKTPPLNFASNFANLLLLIVSLE